MANHAGARLLADLADVVGLTAGLSVAMAPTKQRRRGHDRGEVLADLAVAIAGGAETISDLATLRDQPVLFGRVASHPTVWRTLAAVDEAALERIKTGACPGSSECLGGGRGSGVLCDRHRRHARRGAFGQGTGGADVEARVRVPSVAGLSRCHRRSPRWGAATGQRRVRDGQPITSVCSPTRSPSCRSILPSGR